MNELLQASINLMDFLHNTPVRGFDVPDEIWLPFTKAIDYEQRRAAEGSGAPALESRVVALKAKTKMPINCSSCYWNNRCVLTFNSKVCRLMYERKSSSKTCHADT